MTVAHIRADRSPAARCSAAESNVHDISWERQAKNWISLGNMHLDGRNYPHETSSTMNFIFLINATAFPFTTPTNIYQRIKNALPRLLATYIDRN